MLVGIHNVAAVVENSDWSCIADMFAYVLPVTDAKNDPTQSIGSEVRAVDLVDDDSMRFFRDPGGTKTGTQACDGDVSQYWQVS